MPLSPSVPSRAGTVLAVTALLAAPSAAQLPPPPAPPQNPITAQKAVLGKMLFWDEQLSSDNRVACGTCHFPAADGGDPRTVLPGSVHPGADGLFGSPDDVRGSPGVVHADAGDDYEPSALFDLDPQVTDRASPSFIMAQYAPELFWDGRASSTFVDPESGGVSIPAGGALESQAVAPPVSDVEMAHAGRDWSEITAKLEVVQPLGMATNLPPDVVAARMADPTYPDLFEAAFGTPDITAERIAFALATYQRTLVPDQTPFDLGTLTPQQQQGRNVFNGPGRCNLCHTLPMGTDFAFHNLGVRPPAEDVGRQAVTGQGADLGRFKTPSLRNVGLRPRFMHNGQFATLNQVVNFYNGGGGFPVNRDPLIVPLGLPPQARNNLVAFLSGGLTDPRVANELPPFDRPTLRSEAGFPNPRLLGGAVAGTGGVAPRMLALQPPRLGAPGFKLGVAGGLGGARALLLLGGPGAVPAGPAPAGVVPVAAARRSLLGSVVLNGTGAGAGYQTWHLELPDRPTVAGLVLHAQWWVVDRGVPGGFARSEVVELELF